MSYSPNPTTFDGNLLDNVTGLTVLSTNPYVPARRKLSIEEIARSSKSKVVAGFYNAKDVVVHVGISRTNRDQLEQSMDTLMGFIQGIEKDLVVRQSGGLRRYTATCEPSNVSRDGGSYAELDLIFHTSDHYGYDSVTTQLALVTAFTSGLKTTQITVQGSAQWQVPITTVTFTSVTTGTGATVRLGNDNTGQQVTITRNWVSGDVLVVDAFNQSVKVNGIEVAYTGAIPEWASNVGGIVGYITLSDTFTARTYTMRTIYNKRHV